MGDVFKLNIQFKNIALNMSEIFKFSRVPTY